MSMFFTVGWNSSMLLRDLQLGGGPFPADSGALYGVSRNGVYAYLLAELL